MRRSVKDSLVPHIDVTDTNVVEALRLPCVASGVMKTNMSAKLVALVSDSRLMLRLAMWALRTEFDDLQQIASAAHSHSDKSAEDSEASPGPRTGGLVVGVSTRLSRCSEGATRQHFNATSGHLHLEF